MKGEILLRAEVAAHTAFKASNPPNTDESLDRTTSQHGNIRTPHPSTGRKEGNAVSEGGGGGGEGGDVVSFEETVRMLQYMRHQPLPQVNTCTTCNLMPL